ncbi:MAG: DNA-binding response regulator [Bacteroidetes bacterium]|nr:MAG: DNA-binding response regulator [Bacteroidota bacterium]REK04654.1 MAG: DNA-binding response regulator [Bacteroidota bacterium]REK36129.1 MAG: DNA-binding response regulator [Bacteroidota bacterium]REK51500.1 MAG: DNA-binding response regulator [Bacteroidota bacterium]
MNIISVAIIEDQEEIAEGLEYLIGDSGEFECSTYSTAELALHAFEKKIPDVVLMDIGLPGMSGIECTKILKSKYPELPIMICTVYENDEKIFNALASGASGYILKRTTSASLAEAIRDLRNGGSPISAPIARKVISYLQPRINVSNNDKSELSSREKEILQLLSEGYRNKEVADALHISISTVKTHIYNIYQKLHVTSRVEAINKAGKLR